MSSSPSSSKDIPLARRLAWVTGLRLALLVVLLGLIGLLHFKGDPNRVHFTVQTALGTLATAFALTAAYAGALRRGRHLHLLVNLQLALDPLLWTLIVYLSGGASSGATSFYGLTCLTGAFLTGFRGAAIALGSSMLCFVVLLVATALGWLSPPPDQPPEVYVHSAEELAYSGVVNGLAMIVVAMLAGTLAERLRTAGGELVVARQRANDAERLAALGRVSAALAHEIRNPLGAISGSISMLQMNPTLSEEDQRLCGIIRREASRLDALVSDMMNLAKPRAPSFESVDASALCREVVELASQQGRAVSDVSIVFHSARSTTIRADPAQLRQLVWNLVRNAVQASRAGDCVEVTLEERDARVSLSIRDHGIGLSEEDKTRIFDAFFTTRAQGTGVGLAVVKRIADDHGFDITVHSRAGEGTVFKVELGNSTQVPEGTALPGEQRPTLFPKPV